LEEKPSIDDIVDKWWFNSAELMESPNKISYWGIQGDRRPFFLNLVKTFLDNGYPKEEIKSATLSTKIVKLIWADDVDRICTDQNLKKYKDATRRQWEDAIREVTIRKDVVLSEYIQEKNPTPYIPKESPKEEKPLELDPTDRIKMDTSDISTPEFDLDFLSDIGIDPSSLESANE